MDIVLFFANSNKSPLNSCDKCLTSSDQFLTNASRLNCMLPIKTILLLIVKTIYFSNPFGITFTFTSNLPISCMIK